MQEPRDGTSRGGPGVADAALTALATALALLAAGLTAVDLTLAVAVALLAIAGVATFLIRDIEVILHVLVASVFAESIGIGPARVGRVLAVGAVVAIAARVLLTNWRPPTLAPRTWVPVGLLVAWAWASGTWSAHPGGWVFAMGQLALAISFFGAFALFVRTTEQVRKLLRTFVVGGVLAAFVGILQWQTGARAVGLQGDPNLFALYQVAAIPAAVALARTASGAARTAWFLSLVPLAVSVLASESRGGLLATVIVVGVLVARTTGKRRGLTVVLGLAAIVALAIAGSSLNKRLDPERIANDRASGRIDIWYVAWQAFKDQPLTGLGGGNFVEYSVRLLEREPGVELLKSHLLHGEGIEVHNVYLETLAEYGLPGGIFFVSVLISTASGLRLIARRSDTAAGLALLPMFVAFVVAATFLSVVNSKLLWMLVGIAAAARARWPAQDQPDRRVEAVSA